MNKISLTDAAPLILFDHNRDKVAAILTEREWDVLKMRSGIDDGALKSREVVAKHFDVTPERIRQIEAKAFDKMRRRGLSTQTLYTIWRLFHSDIFWSCSEYLDVPVNLLLNSDNTGFIKLGYKNTNELEMIVSALTKTQPQWVEDIVKAVVAQLKEGSK